MKIRHHAFPSGEMLEFVGGKWCKIRNFSKKDAKA